ncbi:swarming motility regulation protein RssB [Janthinobacterium sp. HH01]|uniref:response regulator transcription factor n=1 Tax=Janthinobacterium sp. HH01 TaxID=1198452 RepID=UPI0002AE8DF3|nr:response regulator transcription factor [Janthinobacterium sp. HH01]ELX12408.1 swarming motility regulation protein RssB [Janthinobacterium sp. HH01]
MNILLVEDDLELGRALRAVLQDDGYTTIWVRLAADAQRQLDGGAFAAIVLDLNLPDGDGMALMRGLRGAGRQLPVVLITARDSLDDRLSGFAGGADDYLVKPFDMAELLARLRAVLRRAHPEAAGRGLWSRAGLSLDERRQAVSCDGFPLALSPTEFNLLLALMQDADRVVTRGELEDRALAGSASVTLDVHMSNLRKKIGEHRVRTVRGVGYMLAP